MKALLRELSRETFILDLREDQSQSPEVPGYTVRRIDAHTLEVVVEKGQALNSVFEHLSRQDITVTSMRNKANRLEELFVDLVGGSRGDKESAA